MKKTPWSQSLSWLNSVWTPFRSCYEPLFRGCYEPLFGVAMNPFFKLLWTPFQICYEPLLPSIKYTEPRLFINITIQNRSNEKNDLITVAELIELGMNNFSRLLWTPFWGCYEPLFRLLWTPFRDCYEPLLPSIEYTEPRLFMNITIQNRSN